MGRLRRHWDITLLLLLFVLLGLAYSVINPLHEATDELRHYRYVRYLVANRALPVQGEEACRSQSHHPPLYYMIGALLTGWIDTGRNVCTNPPGNPFWAFRFADVGVDNKNMYLHGPEEAFPWGGEALAAHLLRALNVMLGAGVVSLTWATGRAIWPEQRALAAGGAAFVAFNPMFLYLSGAINNDIIAALGGAAVLYASVRLLRDPAGLAPRWGLIFGTLYGLALLSKFNLAVAALLVAASATAVAWQRRQWRQWLQVGVITVVVAGLLAGWWFVRNQFLYGEPTGFRMVTELWGARDPAESLPLALQELPLAWTTLWGRFGFGQIPLPEAIYMGLRVVTAVGLLGLLVPVAARRTGREQALLLGLLALDVVLFFAVLFNYMLVSPAGAMGRFFFPALPALGLLTFYGFSRYLTVWGRGQRAVPVLALATNGAMLALALVALFGYLAPAYAAPPSFAEDTPIPNPVDVRFDSLATLRGYRLSAGAVPAGGTLDVDLYWEVNAQPPGNFILFVHLIDEHGVLVAQRDTHPGTGNFPTGFWRPGDRFVDSIRLYIPETAYTPATPTLSVGLAGPDYRLGISGPDGEAWGNALPLGAVQLLPATELFPGAASYPNPLDQNFEDEVRLVGYEYDRRFVAGSAPLAVTLYWHWLQPAESGYTIQLELMDGAGNVRASSRAPLDPGAAETQVSEQSLQPEAALEGGTYQVRLTLLDVESGERHNIVAEDGHLIDDELLLAPVRGRP
ncbi:MAG: phospholipid carrier-dependent glycosyltransferase [Anaerolineae bacterium]|nr:phospholipid carrier-dependent glycosyltransferase [Anaerolineae bacterium]